MGKDTPEMPAAPNYGALVNQQADANRINVYSPFGSATYSGPNRRNLTISPTSQARNIIGLGQNTGQTLAQYANMNTQFLPNSPLNAAGLPENITGIDVSGMPSIGGGSDGYRRALYDQSMSLMQPQFDQQQEALNQDLANRGLPVGGEAYNSTMGEFNRNRGVAMNQAANNATIGAAGLDLQSRGQLFGEGLSQAGLNNTARDAGLRERSMLRGNTLAEINQMMGMAGGQAQMPQSSSPGQVDVLGAANAEYGARMNAYNAGQQQQGGLWNGLLGLAGSVAPFIF